MKQAQKVMTRVARTVFSVEAEYTQAVSAGDVLMVGAQAVRPNTTSG